MCLITIGLPVYNAAPFLADAIRSVLNQTMTDWELLIVDDGSTDDSIAIAQTFTDPRIRVLSDGINRGLAIRLNQIAGLATGHYLARMDADDVMMPDRLQQQVGFMKANPGVDVVGALAYVIDTQNQVYGVRGTTDLPATHHQAAAGVPIIHPTALARTAWFRQHPYREDCRRAEDFDLWLRTVETASFRVIGEPLLFYRERGLPHLKKYRETAAAVRTILRRTDRHLLTRGRFRQLIMYSYGKEIVYRLVALAGQIDWLLGRRNRRLTSTGQAKAQTRLDQATKVSQLPSLID